jgi:hypothetical protein
LPPCRMIGDHPGYEKDSDDGDNSRGDDDCEPFQICMKLII